MKRLLVLALACFFLSLPAEAEKRQKLAASDEAKKKQELIARLSERFDPAKIKEVFDNPKLRLDYSVIPKPHRPGTTANPYFSKKFGLLTENSLARGKKFYLDNKETFAEVERHYGIPPEIILAIFRTETNLGAFFGSHPAIVELYSVYVLRPEKREFALNEIGHFLNIAENLGWDVFEVPGSTMGAIGWPQYEPSSFPLAIDGNKDGVIDLFEPTDGIWSSASHLYSGGWGKTPGSQRRALWNYNHSKHYVDAVLAYADKVKKLIRR